MAAFSAPGSSLAHSVQIILSSAHKGAPEYDRGTSGLFRDQAVLGCSEQTLNPVSEVPCLWPFSVGSLVEEGSDRMVQVLICGSGGSLQEAALLPLGS